MKKKDNNHLGLYVGVSVIIVALVGLILAFFFNGDKETRISEMVKYTETSALVCESDATNEGFFHEDKTQSELNKIKVLFINKQPAQLFYSYIGEYNSERDADYYEAIFHSKYNEYLSEKTLSQNRIIPKFSTVEKEVRIEMYVDMEKISRALGVFFFVNEDEINSFLKLDNLGMKMFYEKKGFSCIINN